MTPACIDRNGFSALLSAAGRNTALRALLEEDPGAAEVQRGWGGEGAGGRWGTGSESTTLGQKSCFRGVTFLGKLWPAGPIGPAGWPRPAGPIGPAGRIRCQQPLFGPSPTRAGGQDDVS